MRTIALLFFVVFVNGAPIQKEEIPPNVSFFTLKNCQYGKKSSYYKCKVISTFIDFTSVRQR